MKMRKRIRKSSSLIKNGEKGGEKKKRWCSMAVSFATIMKNKTLGAFVEEEEE